MFLIGICDVIKLKLKLKYVVLGMKHEIFYLLMTQASTSVGNKVTFY